MRSLSPRSAKATTTRRDRRDIPIKRRRSSESEWSGSEIVTESGSPNAVTASSNEMPCLSTFCRAFSASHSNVYCNRIPLHPTRGRSSGGPTFWRSAARRPWTPMLLRRVAAASATQPAARWPTASARPHAAARQLQRLVGRRAQASENLGPIDQRPARLMARATSLTEHSRGSLAPAAKRNLDATSIRQGAGGCCAIVR